MLSLFVMLSLQWCPPLAVLLLGAWVGVNSVWYLGDVTFFSILFSSIVKCWDVVLFRLHSWDLRYWDR